MFPGYASRLYNEMEDLYKESKSTKLYDEMEYLYKKSKSTKLYDEMEDLYKKKKNKFINIFDSEERKYSVFIGATVLAQTYNNENGENSGYWITKQDWEEVGPDIVLKKCQNIMA